jgi:short-subunit dehydrogenase
MAMKLVLITGCSAGGLGSSLAPSFQKHNLHIFATAHSLSKMSHLADLPNVTLLTLEYVACFRPNRLFFISGEAFLPCNNVFR